MPYGGGGGSWTPRHPISSTELYSNIIIVLVHQRLVNIVCNYDIKQILS